MLTFGSVRFTAVACMAHAAAEPIQLHEASRAPPTLARHRYTTATYCSKHQRHGSVLLLMAPGLHELPAAITAFEQATSSGIPGSEPAAAMPIEAGPRADIQHGTPVREHTSPPAHLSDGVAAANARVALSVFKHCTGVKESGARVAPCS
ncbi:hypothetical_protein [Leishmania infantum]|uniref:Hypothetical_protein n=1 Tax=Leishmania infantum TaxID=5671 RepID=A0A6L0XKR0_LEIIN|nr:hypothetical_protein [Leishmania infantum]SUZ44361.1 hypothetical_protein [Leishmania infantum]